MAVASGIALAGLAVAAAGTAYSVYQGRQAERAQGRARRVAAQQRQAEEARARRQQIAQARRRRAAVVNRAVAGGIADSSGFIGGGGNLQSQLGGNLSFMASSAGRARAFEGFQADATSAGNQAQIGSTVASIGGSIFSEAGGFTALKRGRAQSSTPQSSGFVPSDTPGPRSIFGSR